MSFSETLTSALKKLRQKEEQRIKRSRQLLATNVTALDNRTDKATPVSLLQLRADLKNKPSI